jgi:hypothetical protein
MQILTLTLDNNEEQKNVGGDWGPRFWVSARLTILSGPYYIFWRECR